MKQDWYPDELTQHWTLSAEEREVLDSKTSATRLSFALPYKTPFGTRLSIFVNFP